MSLAKCCVPLDEGDDDRAAWWEFFSPLELLLHPGPDAMHAWVHPSASRKPARTPSYHWAEATLAPNQSCLSGPSALDSSLI